MIVNFSNRLRRAVCLFPLLLGAIPLTAASISLTGTLDPTNANDTLLVAFTVTAPITVTVQTYGYGGTASAPGGKNVAGMVVPAGGFDPYVSLFQGTGNGATFLASNDDGSCPPGTASPACSDSTLTMMLTAGTYTMALSAFDNFSFAENLGAGTLGDGFIGLGSYFNSASNMFRTANYAVDITGSAAGIVPASPPSISKAFGASQIDLNTTTSLTFTLMNPNPAIILTGVGFVDPLPAGLAVATPNGLINNCGGSVVTTAGAGGTITVSGIMMSAATSCTISVTVKGVQFGTYTNMTTNVTSTNAGAGNAASATITSGEPPLITKSFADSQLNSLGSNTTLSFSITNPLANAAPLANIAFTDTLPSGLAVSSPSNGLVGSCGGGTIAAIPGSNLISLSGATLNAGATCTFSVQVTGTQFGVQANETSPVTAFNGLLIGLTAKATINVSPLYFLWFFTEAGGSVAH